MEVTRPENLYSPLRRPNKEIATGSQGGTGQQWPEKSSLSLKESLSLMKEITASNKTGSTSKAPMPTKSHSSSKSSYLSKDTRNPGTTPERIKVPGPGKKSPKPASADRTNKTASKPGLLTITQFYSGDFSQSRIGVNCDFVLVCL